MYEDNLSKLKRENNLGNILVELLKILFLMNLQLFD